MNSSPRLLQRVRGDHLQFSEQSRAAIYQSGVLTEVVVTSWTAVPSPARAYLGEGPGLGLENYSAETSLFVSVFLTVSVTATTLDFGSFDRRRGLRNQLK
jgi:hypothetical protein